MKPGIQRTYFIRAVDGIGPVKIGRSRNTHRRNWEITRDLGRKTRVVAEVEGDFEQDFHKMFASAALGGEWFNWTPEIQAYVDSLRSEGFESGPTRAAIGSFPYPHRTVAEIDAATAPARKRVAA